MTAGGVGKGHGVSATCSWRQCQPEVVVGIDDMTDEGYRALEPELRGELERLLGE